MWIDNAVFFQFFSINFCGAPKANEWDWNVWNGAVAPVNRIQKVTSWIPHLKRLGVNTVYFTPVFQSDSHGYDTRDYYTIDSRLGSNDDFAAVCRSLHQADIRIVLDGVFNHVGRGFWAFRDVQQHRQNSAYADWFYIDWNRNSNDNDGFWYEGWEGCFDLVKLNLDNPQVVQHLFGAIQKWVDLFKIDGLRLDVAYSLSDNFLRELRNFTAQFPDGLSNTPGQFLLLGEILFGDYRSKVNPQMLHSCTNYEVYKGLHSSFNDLNMFEIAHSLERQFGNGGMYTSCRLMTFADNHDVSRLASILQNPAHLPLVYGLLFALPGLPCLYYESEWGAKGHKEDGDHNLRPTPHEPQWNSLTDFISQLIYLYKSEGALRYGTYKKLVVHNKHLVFERSYVDGNGRQHKIVVAVNADSKQATAPCQMGGSWQNLFTGYTAHFEGKLTLFPQSIQYWKQV